MMRDSNISLAVGLAIVILFVLGPVAAQQRGEGRCEAIKTNTPPTLPESRESEQGPQIGAPRTRLPETQRPVQRPAPTRKANVERDVISITSLNAPKEAKKAYEKGLKAMRKRKWKAGQKEFEKAVEIYPQYAAAWFELGKALEEQNKLDEARKAHRRALAADDKLVRPYIQLAGIAARQRKWQEVADTTGRALKLNPIDFPGAYFYNAVASYNLKNLQAAEKSAREALRLDTQHSFPRIDHLLGVILVRKGDLSGAAQHLKNYLELVPNASDAPAVRKQLAKVENFLGPSARKQQ
jgi:superkiller protein 3